MNGMVQAKDLSTLSRCKTLLTMITMFSYLPCFWNLTETIRQTNLWNIKTTYTRLLSNAVLPQFLGLPLFLWPVRQEQLRLVARLSSLIADFFEKDVALGSRLQCMNDQKINGTKAVEFNNGLLCASHKSPSVGASHYNYCMLEAKASLWNLQAIRCLRFASNENGVSVRIQIGAAWGKTAPKFNLYETLRYSA